MALDHAPMPVADAIKHLREAITEGDTPFLDREPADFVKESVLRLKGNDDWADESILPALGMDAPSTYDDVYRRISYGWRERGFVSYANEPDDSGLGIDIE